MGVSSSEDRRRYDRVGFMTKIKISLYVGDKQVKLIADSKDLSLKGIFIRTHREFPINSVCSIQICLTGGVEEIVLSVKGTIIRQTLDGIGIAFDSMDVDTYSHLKNIVRYNRMEDSA